MLLRCRKFCSTKYRGEGNSYYWGSHEIGDLTSIMLVHVVCVHISLFLSHFEYRYSQFLFIWFRNYPLQILRINLKNLWRQVSGFICISCSYTGHKHAHMFLNLVWSFLFRITIASDIWGIGCCVYEMLTKSPPFCTYHDLTRSANNDLTSCQDSLPPMPRGNRVYGCKECRLLKIFVMQLVMSCVYINPALIFFASTAIFILCTKQESC